MFFRRIGNYSAVFVYLSCIEEARRIHGNKYDYSKVIYINNHTKVRIICPIHGEFWQTPHKHTLGEGCPKCKRSTLEANTENYLMSNKILYISQYKGIFPFNKSSKQSLDFINDLINDILCNHKNLKI